LDSRASDRQLGWKQITGIELEAVSPDRVDLAWRVATVDESLGAASCASAAHDNHVLLAERPLRLDTQQHPTDIENQVVGNVEERTGYGHAAPYSLGRESRLGDGPFLIRRQHRQHDTSDIG
jgi:hypothetical protein